jgi:hypothetical protein
MEAAKVYYGYSTQKTTVKTDGKFVFPLIYSRFFVGFNRRKNKKMLSAGK